MVTSIEKMYETNSYIKKYLTKNGVVYLYLFPHLRYMKDYIFEDLAFDALGWKKDNKSIFLFQFKTNEKPTKKILKYYKKAEKKYNVKLRWITRFRGGKIEVYGGKVNGIKEGKIEHANMETKNNN